MNEQLSGRELDKAIALALGYSVKRRRLIAPDGNPVKVATHGIGRFSEDVELREVVGDDDFLWARAPAFSTDANAVIDVCAARGWKLGFDLDGAEILVLGKHPSQDRAHTGIGDTWQEAAARALWAAITAEAAQS